MSEIIICLKMERRITVTLARLCIFVFLCFNHVFAVVHALVSHLRFCFCLISHIGQVVGQTYC